MRTTHALFFLLFLLLNESYRIGAITNKIVCKDVRETALGWALNLVTPNKMSSTVKVTFFVSTRKVRNHVEVNLRDHSALKKSGFDTTKKTILIIHGYKSGGQKKWVLEMTEKLLDALDVNVFAVDWSHGSDNWNYIKAARNTQIASNDIFTFLTTLKVEFQHGIYGNASIEPAWNHLYFIGHSLGAHVSGQTAHLLKEFDFWKIERITGLDPAQPCFLHLDSDVKLDKSDADFVDIIHTQVGRGGSYDALGLNEDIGHVDFYVSGGIIQPQCEKSFFSAIWSRMVCSHKLSYAYFTESIANSLNGGCNYPSYSWNGTYEDAQRVIGLRMHNDLICSNCPELGLNAAKSGRQGRFFVITSMKAPYCDLDFWNRSFLEKLLYAVKRLRGTKIEKSPINIYEDKLERLKKD